MDFSLSLRISNQVLELAVLLNRENGILGTGKAHFPVRGQEGVVLYGTRDFNGVFFLGGQTPSHVGSAASSCQEIFSFILVITYGCLLIALVLKIPLELKGSQPAVSVVIGGKVLNAVLESKWDLPGLSGFLSRALRIYWSRCSG